ncbi:hypothetical protein EHQ58_03385 [Leptospira ognonensis]|uniref:Uncharacterized protein n=1 Tax=Leptospira ognonensis TaxID=2484945 RepID=A0A4R9K9P9_9LEPT|nr:hypothetical protein [Leptospira ognonensis]TGL62256.1 hypothetical protein EHQ58_03385 [Leptospira ognonensis]
MTEFSLWIQCAVTLKKSELELNDIISRAVENQKILTLKTYLLSDYGEHILKVITASILKKYNRLDLMDISYAAAKELVINATKANLKRVMFREAGLDINRAEDYEKGMANFKGNLREDKIGSYKSLFKEFDLPVYATFYYTHDVLNIKIKNAFPLLPVEETRIRDKFKKAISFSNLIDFFMEYGDNTEGAGMGITMVGILLDQSGINKHAFSLYSSEKYQETVAKIEIPLSNDYISKRKMFQKESEELGLPKEELRKTFSYNYKLFQK